MAEDARPERGLLDTSVVVALSELDPGDLPAAVAVSTLTMAELAAGPHATDDHDERARRQDRLQRAEAAFHPLPFDANAALAYTASAVAASMSWDGAIDRQGSDLGL